MKDMSKILVVDDEEALREIIVDAIEPLGAKVYQASGGLEAIKIVHSNPVDLVISDIRMPLGSGVNLLKDIVALTVGRPKVILISGFADIEIADIYSLGADAFLSKPFNLDHLLMAVQRTFLTLEKKFSVPMDQLLISQEITAQSTEQVKWARGGFTLYSSRKVKSGMTVNFTVNDVKGQGIVRWNTDDAVAVEVIYVEQKSMEVFNKLTQGERFKTTFLYK